MFVLALDLPERGELPSLLLCYGPFFVMFEDSHPPPFDFALFRLKFENSFWASCCVLLGYSELFEINTHPEK